VLIYAHIKKSFLSFSVVTFPNRVTGLVKIDIKCTILSHDMKVKAISILNAFS